MRWVLPDFPAYQGTDLLGSAYANARIVPLTTRYNYDHTTPMNFYTPCFVCRRGGMRHKFLYDNSLGPFESPIGFSMRVSREPVLQDAGCNISRLETGGATMGGSFQAEHFREEYSGAFGGTAVQPTRVNPVIEVDLPFYSNLRFHNGANLSSNEGHVSNPMHRVDVVATCDTLFGQVGVLDWVAAADDFSLSFFIGAPLMWWVPEVPKSAETFNLFNAVDPNPP